MAIRLLVAGVLVFVASCSKTGLTLDSGSVHDGTAQISAGADGLLVARDLRGSEASLGCASTFTGQCDDCPFPIDWTSAQNPSRWCGLYKVFPPTSLALCPDLDGFNRAVVFYNSGGEMGIIDRLFFVYDSTTGAFIQEQFKPWGSDEASCVLGLPGEASHPSSSCQFLGTSLDSVCLKGLPDAG